MNALRVRRMEGERKQRGVVLFVALIVLIVMTMAGLALMRQMGIGTSIAGNIAFKETATSVADRGTEEARLWITNNALVTSVDSFLPDGYHSSWTGNLDPTTFDWVNEARTIVDLPDAAQTGNTVRVYIQRLCATAGMSALNPAQQCSDTVTNNPFNSRGGGGYPSVLPGTSSQPLYRITTRVDGPRSTVSYTQALIQ